MTILFTDEELEWLDKEPFNWHVKDGAPGNIKKSLEEKLGEPYPYRKGGSEESAEQVNVRNAMTLQKLWHVDAVLAVIEEKCFGGEIDDWDKAFKLLEIVGAEIPTKKDIQTLNRSGFRMDDEGEEEEGGKKGGHGNTRLPYGLCNREGIDTKGMTPRQAWAALEGKGYSAKEEYKKLKERNDPKKTGSSAHVNSPKTFNAEKHEQLKKDYKHRSLNERGTEIAEALRVLPTPRSSYYTVYGDEYINAKKKLASLQKKYGYSTSQEANAEYERQKKAYNDALDAHQKATEDELEYRKSLWGKYAPNEPQTYWGSSANSIMVQSASKEELDKLDAMVKATTDALDYAYKMQPNDSLRVVCSDFSWYEGRIKEYEEQENHKKERTKILKGLKDKYDREDAEYIDSIKSKLPTVDDCKTIEDLDEYCYAHGFFRGVDKPIDNNLTIQNLLSPMLSTSFSTVEAGKFIVKGFEDICNKQPAFKCCLQSVEMNRLGEHTYANADPRDFAIQANTKWFEDEEAFKKSYSETLKLQFSDEGKYADGVFKKAEYSFHVQGTGPDSVMKHEASHVMDYWLTSKVLGTFSAFDKKGRFSTLCKKEVCKKLKIRQKDAWKQVSVYGQKNDAEFFAEAYSAYLCGVHTPVIDAVGEYTDTAIKNLGLQIDSKDNFVNKDIYKVFDKLYNENTSRNDGSADIYFGIAESLGYKTFNGQSVKDATDFIKKNGGVTKDEIKKVLKSGGGVEGIKSLIKDRQSQSTEPTKQTEPKPKGRNARCTGFANKELGKRHYEDHVKTGEFKDTLGIDLTEEQYFERGKDLLQEPADGKKILGYQDHVGRIVRFNPDTCEYATGVPGREMSTYFIAKYDHQNHKKPTKSIALDYYNRCRDNELSKGGIG